MERIRTKAQFQLVLAYPPVVTSAHFALHKAPLASPDEPSRVGVVLPKRWARRAVTRNVLRRQIYAVAALAPVEPAQAFVVRLRRAFDVRDFPSASSVALKQSVRSELTELFRRFRLPAGHAQPV